MKNNNKNDETTINDFKSKNDLIKMFIDNTPIAYIILDAEYRIHYINESFARLRKLDPTKTIGDRCFNISNGGVRCARCAVAHTLEHNEKAFVSRKDALPDGTVRYIDDYAFPLQVSENGKVEFVLEIMINRTQEMLLREQRNTDYDEILTIFSKLIDAKDTYTASHSISVRTLSLNLARKLTLSNEQIFDITVAASLHDIGKVCIPSSIINKKGPLNDEEYAIIKKHPDKSDEMLENFDSFTVIREYSRHHHERVDGKGYPDGICGTEISLGAKIIAVADTYDAITSTRSYRNALSHDFALEEIKRVAGTQLDTEVVQAFIALDFKNLSNDINYTPAPKIIHVNRKLQNYQRNDSNQENSFLALQKKLNFADIFYTIFQHTPCGYVLMDTEQKILFSSDYFLRYMGIAKKHAIGAKCYEAIGTENAPYSDCAIKNAIQNKKMVHTVNELHTNNKQKIFDLFAVPLIEKDDAIKYVIEIIVDRTQEVLLERKREKDFSALITMLTNILDEQKDLFDHHKLSAEIIQSQQRLHDLLSKKATRPY